MKSFPKLDTFSDDELIHIIFDEKDDWQEEAIQYAKRILSERGIPEEYCSSRIVEIRKALKLVEEQEIEVRKNAGFGIIDMIFMFVFWPRYLLSNWFMASNGYIRMRKQRLIILSAGFLFTFLIISYGTSSYDDMMSEQIAEIEEKAVIDSIADSQVDWTGHYQFIDSSSIPSEHISWYLRLVKVQGEHSGNLQIATKNETYEVQCIGLIKGDYIEFYPDTSYEILDKYKVSYYSLLFSFGKDSNGIVTKWGELRPVYSDRRPYDEFFKLDNSM